MEKKIKKNYYKKYKGKHVVKKQTTFSAELAEEANKIMAIFNSNVYGLRLNNNVLINIAVRSYLNHLKSMSLKDEMLFLRKDIIDYSMGEKYD